MFLKKKYTHLDSRRHNNCNFSLHHIINDASRIMRWTIWDPRAFLSVQGPMGHDPSFTVILFTLTYEAHFGKICIIFNKKNSHRYSMPHNYVYLVWHSKSKDQGLIFWSLCPYPVHFSLTDHSKFTFLTVI